VGTQENSTLVCSKGDQSLAKRYLLYLADAELNERDLEGLTRILEGRHGKLKVIAVKGNTRAVIVRTTAEAAAKLREDSGRVTLNGKNVAAVLTSGVIGKLKRRAKGSGASGNEVLQ
jgi:hypothetical protein